MAYLDIHNLYVTPSSSTDVAGVEDEAATFTALEWSVIALAQRDPLSSLGAPSRVSRAIGGLFGLGTTSRLADPRLEALRRLAVLAWRRGFALPVAELNRFMAQGFSEAQIETLVTSVTGLRIDTAPRR